MWGKVCVGGKVWGVRYVCGEGKCGGKGSRNL